MRQRRSEERRVQHCSGTAFRVLENSDRARSEAFWLRVVRAVLVWMLVAASLFVFAGCSRCLRSCW